MSGDSIDRYLERTAREEEEDINRKQGEMLLAMFDEAVRSRQERDRLVEILRRAHQAKAEEAEQA